MSKQVLERFDGDREAVASLLSDGWEPLLAHILTEPIEGTPSLLEELYREAPRLSEWWNGIKQAQPAYEKAHDVLLRTTVVQKAYFAWLSASAAELDETHPIGLELRVDQAGRTTQNLDDVRALYQSLDAHPNGDVHRHRVALLVAQRALEANRPVLAITFAKKAAEHAAGDPKALDVAARLLAGAHMEAGNLDAAFTIYDEVLERRGPMFGGLGMSTSMGGGPKDARTSALQDARVIGGWARRDTPEWVRALGSLALAFEGDTDVGADLMRRFEDAVEDLTAGPRPIDQLEVVIRQLDEREHFGASLIASRIGSDALPADTWILSVYANQAARAGAQHDALEAYERLAAHAAATRATRLFAWERAGAMAAGIEADELASETWEKAAALCESDEERWSLNVSMAEARAASSPDRAIELAWGVFESIRDDPNMLAENPTGHRTVDVLTRLLEARGDQKALDVQGSLLAAKRTLWGENVPAVWVELHNLGAVHAGLGEVDRARELVTEAHGKLLAACGPHHEYTQLCVRTLSRLDVGG